MDRVRCEELHAPSALILLGAEALCRVALDHVRDELLDVGVADAAKARRGVVVALHVAQEIAEFEYVFALKE